MASSGVEKIIRLWSPFPFSSQSSEDLIPTVEGIRPSYTEEYHDFSSESEGMEESRRTLAMFDFWTEFDPYDESWDELEEDLDLENREGEEESEDEKEADINEEKRTRDDDETENQVEQSNPKRRRTE